MVQIIDATLREGLQAPGVTLTEAQMLHIARCIHDSGADMIECGHAYASGRIQSVIAALSREPFSLPVLSHARCREEDINAVKTAGAPWIGLFLGVNDISRAARVNEDVNTLHARIRHSVAYAKKAGLHVRYTVEDASRTPLHLLLDTYSIAIEAGADCICFADSVGILEPEGVKTAIEAMRAAFPQIPLETHFHDDRGLATANALQAIDSGCDRISCCINGIGERCGVTDAATLAANLHHRGMRKLTNGAALRRASDVVAAYTRSPVPARAPVTGEHAFTHTARLHRLAAEKAGAAYCWTAPETFGREQRCIENAEPRNPAAYAVTPFEKSATELKYHRHGPGKRIVALDYRSVPETNHYQIIRYIPYMDDYGKGHVDPHTHICDSFFVFLGAKDDLTGLRVEVMLDGVFMDIESPKTVFIPAGLSHSYRVISGSGIFINTVACGEYNKSLLEREEEALRAKETTPA